MIGCNDANPMATEMTAVGVKVHGDVTSQSASFRAMEGSTHEDDNNPSESIRPLLPRWYPFVRRDGQWQPIFHGNGEALGWTFDTVGRSSAFIGSGAFLGTALLLLAKEAAGCSIEKDPVTNEIPECNERIYGIRPSSLLTTYTMVTGILSAAMLPLMGAMLDFTPHRLWFGRFLSASFCVLMIPSLFISSKTWVMVAVFQVFVAFVGWAQTMVTYSYLPELTDSPDRLNEYNQSFTVFSFSSMVFYLIITTGIANLVGWSDDTVATSRLGTSIALGIAVVFLSLAWGSLMQKRAAAHILREDQSLWTAGFIQVFRTIKFICGHLPALKWFYVSLMFIDAAIHSLATIMLTYLTDTLGFSSTENGTAILIMLIGSIPGAFVAGRTVKWLNPVRSCAFATLVLTVNTLIVSVFLTGVGQVIRAYVLFAVYGIGIGWKWTTDRLLASLLIPAGQDAELMGVYLFAGQVMSWLPPLVYTILNEFGVSQSANIGVLSIYFTCGFGALLLIGNYEYAIEQTGR